MILKKQKNNAYGIHKETNYIIYVGGKNMKDTIMCIGEALIDFIPSQKGVALKDVNSFERIAGGAPTNVAAAVAKL